MAIDGYFSDIKLTTIGKIGDCQCRDALLVRPYKAVKYKMFYPLNRYN